MPGIEHESWFYEKFVTKEHKDGFRLEKAEDWARLQVMDGDALRPALGNGFKGAPTSEQMKTLYDMAGKGKLVYFRMADAKPLAVTHEGVNSIDLNPKKPIEPVKPADKASKSEKTNYNNEMMRYPYRMKTYERNMTALNNLGEGFKAALDTYNGSRNMQTEQTEATVHGAVYSHVDALRRLNNTDKFINDIFGPRPVASPNYFCNSTGGGGNEFVFKYSEYDEQFAPNGYDLPDNSKLNAEEVATINFAMAGASKPVEKFLREERNFGERAAKTNAINGFQMMLTGSFGIPRIAQPLPGFGVLDATFKLGKKAIEEYNNGNADLLGKNLADSVRTIKAACTGYSWTKVSSDMVSGARVIERIQKLFDEHEDIKKAANLSEKEHEFMRGYVQLGKAFDHYLEGMIKFNDVTSRLKAQAEQDKNKDPNAPAADEAQAENGKNKGKKAEKRVEPLSANDKNRILADAVLRKLVEKELIADKEVKDQDPHLQEQLSLAKAKDFEEIEIVQAWQREKAAGQDEERLYRAQNDLGFHNVLLDTMDLDHNIINIMAQDGMLEKMRADLMQNPAIRAAAAKEPFEFTSAELANSEKLDELVAQTEVTKNSWKTSEADKRAWFESVKTALIGDNPENWLNPNAKGDSDRLMISYTRYDNEKKALETNMVGLEAILKGGIKDLENPSKETLDILHEHAARGNLYYYDVGKDMPIRIGAEGKQPTTNQLEKPPTPTLWQKIANKITFGWAYAEIFNPKPDKDPAAFEAILEVRTNRSKVVRNEAAQRRQEIEATERQPAEREEIERIQQPEEKTTTNDMLGRKLSAYNKENVDMAMARVANVKEAHMPAADKTKIALTAEEIGVLAAIASGAKSLSIESKDSGIVHKNNPEKYYPRIIKGHYAEGNALEGGARSFDAIAHFRVKKALETGDMDMLGQMLVEGLTQNNNVLSGMTDLSDYYTIYAELGSKMLDIVNKNDQLKQAFNKQLDGDTKQIDMAHAAKNISDLRVKVLPLKDKLMEDFKKYQEPQKAGEKKVPVEVSSNEDISTIGQLCTIQHYMKNKLFDLSTTEYKDPTMVDRMNTAMKNSTLLEQFRTKHLRREDTLDDIVLMAKLYTNAINLKKPHSVNNRQLQNSVDKQNDMQNQQSQKINPMT